VDEIVKTAGAWLSLLVGLFVAYIKAARKYKKYPARLK
jgi:hypothetical protein